MQDYIFTGLAPNTQKDDIALAGRLLFRPGSWLLGDAVEKVEAWFKNFLPVGYAVAFASGRGALRAILNSFALNSDDEVLLQAYTCVSVPGAVRAAGGKPVYVDIEPDTLNMSAEDLERKLSPRSRAIIIQHTFGSPADMDKLLRIARAKNLFVIEDCAHTIGGNFAGQHVGTFGGAAIFSFGRDKAVSSVFGGVAVTANKSLAEKILTFRKSRGQASSTWVLRQLLHPIITGIAKTAYGSGLGRVVLRLALATGLISKAVCKNEKAGLWEDFADKAMPQALALMALHQLEKLPSYNKHRVELADFYRFRLEAAGVERQRNKEGADAPLMRYTIFVKDAAELRRTMKNNGVFLGDWYAQSLAPEGADYQRFGYNPQTCPVAESRARESVNLPLHIDITMHQAGEIVNGVKSFLRS